MTQPLKITIEFIEDSEGGFYINVARSQPYEGDEEGFTKMEEAARDMLTPFADYLEGPFVEGLSQEAKDFEAVELVSRRVH